MIDGHPEKPSLGDLPPTGTDGPLPAPAAERPRHLSSVPEGDPAGTTSHVVDQDSHGADVPVFSGVGGSGSASREVGHPDLLDLPSGPHSMSERQGGQQAPQRVKNQFVQDDGSPYTDDLDRAMSLTSILPEADQQRLFEISASYPAASRSKRRELKQEIDSIEQKIKDEHAKRISATDGVSGEEQEEVARINRAFHEVFKPYSKSLRTLIEGGKFDLMRIAQHNLKDIGGDDKSQLFAQLEAQMIADGEDPGEAKRQIERLQSEQDLDDLIELPEAKSKWKSLAKFSPLILLGMLGMLIKTVLKRNKSSGGMGR